MLGSGKELILPVTARHPRPAVLHKMALKFPTFQDADAEVLRRGSFPKAAHVGAGFTKGYRKLEYLDLLISGGISLIHSQLSS